MALCIECGHEFHDTRRCNEYFSPAMAPGYTIKCRCAGKVSERLGEKSAAPKLPDRRVRWILEHAVETRPSLLNVTPKEVESLAQEVLDSRSAHGVNEGLLKRYEKLVTSFDEWLATMILGKDDATFDEVLSAWQKAKRELTRVGQKPSRCDECDPSFGCFDGSRPCSKKPLP